MYGSASDSGALLEMLPIKQWVMRRVKVFSTVICTYLLMRLLRFNNKALVHQKTSLASY